jgi:hypothetical protein
MSENYLSYVSSVLGIDVVAVPRPVFLFEKNSSLQSVLEPGPVAELLEKILSAMGWQPHEIEIRECTTAELTEQARAAEVLFTSKETEANWNLFETNVKTYHPAEMLKEPSLKKLAWESLQKLRRTK